MSTELKSDLVKNGCDTLRDLRPVAAMSISFYVNYPFWPCARSGCR